MVKNFLYFRYKTLNCFGEILKGVLRCEWKEAIQAGKILIMKARVTKPRDECKAIRLVPPVELQNHTSWNKERRENNQNNEI